MKKIFFIFGFIGLMLMSSCSQYVSRKMGGTTTINLKPGEKLMEATWKEGNIWYLTEPMDEDYTPKTKTFHESSMAGVLEGTVIFVETR